MTFQVEALPADTLQHLFELSDAERMERDARLLRVGPGDTAPCRISLEDAKPGEEIILASYEHLPFGSPFRATGPIFVRKGVAQAEPAPGEVPDALRRRLISLRAYDRNDQMILAEVAEGRALEALITRFFEEAETAYLHAHFAPRGCYLARIVRC